MVPDREGNYHLSMPGWVVGLSTLQGSDSVRPGNLLPGIQEKQRPTAGQKLRNIYAVNLLMEREQVIHPG